MKLYNKVIFLESEIKKIKTENVNLRNEITEQTKKTSTIFASLNKEMTFLRHKLAETIQYLQRMKNKTK